MVARGRAHGTVQRMTTHRLARIWKEERRWHWYLIIAPVGDANGAHVYQGDEPTWSLAKAMFQLADFQHGRELDNRA